jgi:putative ABC transport system substrate-binding protein
LTTTAITKSGTTGIAQFAGLQGVAPAFGVELSPIGVRDAGEIERAAFARSPNGGLIVTGSAPAAIHRDLIVSLAARHKLSAVYYGRFIVTAGGLISYGPDLVDQHRRAAGYVDRILKGEKPADLPVQAPTKYELVINLKTAKALGLEAPPTPLARAEVVVTLWEILCNHAGASDDVAEVRGLGSAGVWVKHSPPKRLRNASAVAASGKQNRI